jgi:hypothetical protein
MANEIRRVGRSFFVQTPNYRFFFEPHFLFPFFQFLPFGLRVFLAQHLPLGLEKRSPDYASAAARVRAIRLLTKAELTALFPEAQLYEERMLGMTKSFVVYRTPPLTAKST